MKLYPWFITFTCTSWKATKSKKLTMLPSGWPFVLVVYKFLRKGTQRNQFLLHFYGIILGSFVSMWVSVLISNYLYLIQYQNTILFLLFKKIYFRWYLIISGNYYFILFLLTKLTGHTRLEGPKLRQQSFHISYCL